MITILDSPPSQSPEDYPEATYRPASGGICLGHDLPARAVPARMRIARPCRIGRGLANGFIRAGNVILAGESKVDRIHAHV